MWTYHQRSGELWRNGAKVATGYSGHGEGLNNPEMQYVKGVGPLPQGVYHIDGVYTSKKVGAFALVLNPAPETVTKGRGDFRVHGDNQFGNHTASDGCIILPRGVRENMWLFKDHNLTVVE